MKLLLHHRKIRARAHPCKSDDVIIWIFADYFNSILNLDFRVDFNWSSTSGVQDFFRDGPLDVRKPRAAKYNEQAVPANQL